MTTFIFYLLTLIGSIALSWYFFIRVRGAWNYWIRPATQPAALFLGEDIPLKATQEEILAALNRVNAAARTLDQHVNVAIREWDSNANKLFIGVQLHKKPTSELPEGFYLKTFSEQKVIRISGGNRRDERSLGACLSEWLEFQKIEIDRSRRVRLSGQSYQLSQWELKSSPTISPLSQLSEKTFQLRDNLVLPLVGTLIAVGLVGTKQPALFALGIVFLVFLSGVCKFVFIHQRTDDAEESHLQGY